MQFSDIKAGKPVFINGALRVVARVFADDPTGGNGRHLVEAVETTCGETHFHYIHPQLGQQSQFKLAGL